MDIQKELKTKFYKVMPYKELAEKHNTTYDYVRLIASGKRKALRGKGLAIMKDLKDMIEKKEKEEAAMKAVLDKYYSNKVRLAETVEEERELLELKVES